MNGDFGEILKKLEEYKIAQEEDKFFYKPTPEKPRNFSEYIGQKNVVNMLKLIVSNCKEQKKVLDHILFFGREGLGKTSLAYILAEEMNTKLLLSNAGEIVKPDIIRRYIYHIKYGYMWLIDEIHRLKPSIEEILYIVMEDFRYAGQEIPKFTLIGCTTLPSKLNKPLLNRFVIQLRLEIYTISEISEILSKFAVKLNVSLTEKAKEDIAIRSRGVPRIAVSYLKQCSNLTPDGIIDENVTGKLFDFLGIDDLGITPLGRQILKELKNYGKPVGSITLARTLGQNISLIEDEEEYLLRLKFIRIGKGGREITETGMRYLCKLF